MWHKTYNYWYQVSYSNISSKDSILSSSVHKHRNLFVLLIIGYTVKTSQMYSQMSKTQSPCIQNYLTGWQDKWNWSVLKLLLETQMLERIINILLLLFAGGCLGCLAALWLQRCGISGGEVVCGRYDVVIYLTICYWERIKPK